MPSPHRLMLQARLVLAAFLLSLGVAVAAPALRPAAIGAFELVCAGGVMKLVERGAADSAGLDRADRQWAAGGLMDCPLCAPPGLLPVSLPVLVPVTPLALLPLAFAQTLLPDRAEALPPARGPPLTI